jgi:hypothetical protein
MESLVTLFVIAVISVAIAIPCNILLKRTGVAALLTLVIAVPLLQLVSYIHLGKLPMLWLMDLAIAASVVLVCALATGAIAKRLRKNAQQGAQPGRGKQGRAG